jgi:hypothetical protein
MWAGGEPSIWSTRRQRFGLRAARSFPRNEEGQYRNVWVGPLKASEAVALRDSHNITLIFSALSRHGGFRSYLASRPSLHVKGDASIASGGAHDRCASTAAADRRKSGTNSGGRNPFRFYE